VAGVREHISKCLKHSDSECTVGCKFNSQTRQAVLAVVVLSHPPATSTFVVVPWVVTNHKAVPTRQQAWVSSGLSASLSHATVSLLLLHCHCRVAAALLVSLYCCCVAAVLLLLLHAGDYLIEYVGQLVRPVVTDHLEKTTYNSMVGSGTSARQDCAPAASCLAPALRYVACKLSIQPSADGWSKKHASTLSGTHLFDQHNPGHRP
jgi:hypothetical protein